LCDQWQKELAQKFAIDAKIIRTNTLARLERELPRQDLSVFEYYPYAVVSIDFIKSHRRRDAFLLHVPQLVIVDEAHSASRPAGQAVSQQQRHELVHDLAKKKEQHLILVTATPHSGIEESFFSLLGLVKAEFEQYNLDELDKTNREELARHFIQRQRADVKRWMGTTTLFPQREAYEVSFRLSAEYKHLFNDVYRFARGLVTGKDSESEAKQRVRYWAALALLRCVMSSPAAAKAALLARIERLTETTNEEQDYAPDVYDPTDLEASADVVPAHVIHESEASMTETERRKLREFSRRSEALKVRGDSDTKIAKAEELVRDLLKDGFRPIIFCRFIATSDYVAEELQSRLRKDFKNLQILSVTGAYTEEEREIRIQELAQSKQRVLVATDCLSEGINLQEYFDAVIHYDLPWNPNRLEQREGRVDRYGQKTDPVKAVILYGSDNPIDGAVLNVLLRKAKKIHKRLGITVPIPVNSESVVETVLQALFWRGEDQPQLGLFDDDAPVVEVHRKWERAADREKKSRTLFAQHAINPSEVSKELEATDAILGDPKLAERFVKTACQRLNTQFEKRNGHWAIDLGTLPQSIQAKLSNHDLSKITFKQPEEENVVQVTRNHPLISTLADYLFDTALNPDGERTIAARCAVLRSQDVESITSLLLLRLRFLIKESGEGSTSVAEECMVVGFKGEMGSEEWLTIEEAEDLLDKVEPSSNISESDKQHWIGDVLKHFELITDKIEKIATERARGLLESHKKLRKAVKAGKVSIEPLLPVDVLSVSVILPEPNI